MLGWVLVAVGALTFLALMALAWVGELGLAAILLLGISAGAYLVGRRRVPAAARKKLDVLAKVLFTVGGMMALLRHPIDVGGEHLPLHYALAQYITEVDGTTFVIWGTIAMLVKFCGVITSAFAWHLLLVGQGIRFPFWSKVMTAFLIGRFIGTFLPSTLGLDGYTLYEAGRYSNQWSRVITAKALEKFIGVTGLFLGMVLTMPFGYQVIVDVTDNAGRPEAAPLLAAAILLVAGGISAVVVVGLVRPVLIVGGMQVAQRVAQALGRVAPPAQRVVDKLLGPLRRFTDAVGAYEGKVGLLMLALSAKFVTHFTTAVVYVCTALAIGVVGAKFWPIVFGSTIQILATVLSPTIAGEGAREAFQALLLSNQLGGVAQAVLSAALGFIAAEAATLWGGIFLWTRTPGWRPRYAEVDGQQVDYAWIGEEDHGGFSADAVREMQRVHGGN